MLFLFVGAQQRTSVQFAEVRGSFICDCDYDLSSIDFHQEVERIADESCLEGNVDEALVQSTADNVRLASAVKRAIVSADGRDVVDAGVVYIAANQRAGNAGSGSHLSRER